MNIKVVVGAEPIKGYETPFHKADGPSFVRVVYKTYLDLILADSIWRRIHTVSRGC